MKLFVVSSLLCKQYLHKILGRGKEWFIPCLFEFVINVPVYSICNIMHVEIYNFQFLIHIWNVAYVEYEKCIKYHLSCNISPFWIIVFVSKIVLKMYIWIWSCFTCLDSASVNIWIKTYFLCHMIQILSWKT